MHYLPGGHKGVYHFYLETFCYIKNIFRKAYILAFPLINVVFLFKLLLQRNSSHLNLKHLMIEKGQRKSKQFSFTIVVDKSSRSPPTV